MEQEVQKHNHNFVKVLLIVGYLASVGIAVFLGYNAGKNSTAQNFPSDALSVVPTAQVQAAQTQNVPTPDLNGICGKSGLSQKSEFLLSYVIKDGDTLQKIAQDQLGDSKRVNELVKLNENTGGMTAGGVLYLPPSFVKNSSGNLAQASGMIVKKDNSFWQISYGGGISGLGIQIPTYYFSEVSNKDEFKLGDCVTLFLDDGVRVYSVVKQN